MQIVKKVLIVIIVLLLTVITLVVDYIGYILKNVINIVGLLIGFTTRLLILPGLMWLSSSRVKKINFEEIWKVVADAPIDFNRLMAAYRNFLNRIKLEIKNVK